jgi:hypothetical protein
LSPGSYRLMAFYSSGQTGLRSRALNFRLDTGDQTSVQLSLLPGEDLAGTLKLTGDAAAGPPEKRIVRLVGDDSSRQGQPAAGEAGKDGSFHIANILPGKYRPVVEPMPENGYVKEVALDGKAMDGQELDFSQGVDASRLRITISLSGGQISGRVLGKDGEPALGPVMVFFTTGSTHMDPDIALRVSDGTYSFKAIRPGKYRLFALDVVELMPALAGDGNSDETIGQFSGAAEEIEIKEGDRISKDIPVQTTVPGKKEDHVPPR